jgi:S1-C subfamily serine protease
VIVLPTELSLPESRREELTMDVDPPEIPLLPGDFAWMVPYEDVARKVRLGVMMRADGARVVVEKVLPGSPAEKVGMLAGDVFSSLDGFPVTEQGDVVLAISGKKPGDWVQVRVLREGNEMLFAPLLEVPPDTPAPHPAKP